VQKGKGKMVGFTKLGKVTEGQMFAGLEQLRVVVSKDLVDCWITYEEHAESLQVQLWMYAVEWCTTVDFEEEEEKDFYTVTFVMRTEEEVHSAMKYLTEKLA
jgi:hypothetical protein